MSDKPYDLVLEMLRAIRMDSVEVCSDLGEVKERLGLLILNLASLSRRMDGMGGNLEQVKRRLGLIEA